MRRDHYGAEVRGERHPAFDFEFQSFAFCVLCCRVLGLEFWGSFWDLRFGGLVGFRVRG